MEFYRASCINKPGTVWSNLSYLRVKDDLTFEAVAETPVVATGVTAGASVGTAGGEDDSEGFRK